MYRCELCNTILLKRNKTKHNQTRKHKYYSKLILNRYVIKNVQVIKLKIYLTLLSLNIQKNSVFSQLVFS